MNCPHCGYKSGWDTETLEETWGEKGPFFDLKMPLGRVGKDGYAEFAIAYGCPSCRKMFIVEEH